MGDDFGSFRVFPAFLLVSMQFPLDYIGTQCQSKHIHCFGIDRWMEALLWPP